MSEEIAVLLDRRGEAAVLHEADKIIIYQKICRHWKQVRALDFKLPQELSMFRLRYQMRDLINFLDGCKIFAASSIGGVAYFELEKAGIKVWEVEGEPPGFLQLIIDDQKNSLAPKSEAAKPPVPVAEEIGPGHLRISLLGIQGISDGPTSKQIIMPILKQGRFQTLEILCDHVPPWLEIKILASEINGLIEKSGPGEVKITLFH